MDEVAHSKCRPDVVWHAPFYSLCQAVFYLFVFRHKKLLEAEGGGREREGWFLKCSRLHVGIHFVRQLNFDRIISSKLNPLKVCRAAILLSTGCVLLFCV